MSAQAGFDVDFTKHLDGIGTVSTGFGYLFEYIANNQCIAGNNGIKHYFSLKVGLAL